MSRYGYCHDEYEHRRDARRDAERNSPDRDYYDRHTSDPCKDAYTEEFDRERRHIREREDEDRVREEAAERRAAYERRMQLEDELYEEQY